MLHTQLSCVARVTESCCTCGWVVLHMRLSRVACATRLMTQSLTHSHESCHDSLTHPFACVMSYMQISHVAHVNQSCLSRSWVMSHTQVTSHIHIYTFVHASFTTNIHTYKQQTTNILTYKQQTIITWRICTQPQCAWVMLCCVSASCHTHTTHHDSWHCQ